MQKGTVMLRKNNFFEMHLCKLNYRFRASRKKKKTANPQPLVAAGSVEQFIPKEHNKDFDAGLQ